MAWRTLPGRFGSDGVAAGTALDWDSECSSPIIWPVLPNKRLWRLLIAFALPASAEVYLGAFADAIR